jgi:hypothetical protein
MTADRREQVNFWESLFFVENKSEVASEDINIIFQDADNYIHLFICE